MKLKRVLAAGAGLVAALVVIAGALLAWAYATESGARFVLSRALAAADDALAAADGALVVDEISGRLSGEIVLAGILYRDAGVEVAIERLALRLSLASVLERMIVVEDLQSSVIRYRELEAAAAGPSARSAPSALPLAVRLDRVSIAGVSIERGDGGIALGRITASGIVERTTAYVQRLEILWQDFFVSIQGGLGWIDGLVLDGVVSWSGDFRGEQWLGSAEVRGQWPALEIEQELIEPVVQSASGSVLLGDVPAFDLSFVWRGLGEIGVMGGLDSDASVWRATITAAELVPAAVVPEWPGIWDLAGNLSLDLADGYRVATDDLRAEARLGGEALGLDFAGALTGSAVLEIDRLIAVLGRNRASVAGSIGPDLRLDLEIEAELEELSSLAALAARETLVAGSPAAELAAALSGRVSAALAVTGDPSAPLVSGRFRLEDSSYAGLALGLALDFATPAAGDAAVTVDALDLRLGASRLEASGRLGAGLLRGSPDADAELDLALEATLSDLAELGRLAERDEIRALGIELPAARLSGQAAARVMLGGSAGRPDIEGELSLTGFGYDDLELAAVTLGGELGLYDGGPADLRLSAAAEGWTARLAATGAIEAGRWIGRLGSLEIDERRLGAWTLTAPAEFAVGPGSVEVANACLAHAASGICAELSYGGTADRLVLDADDFELGVLGPLLPPTVSLEGRVTLDARLDAAGGVPAGMLTASGQGIGIDVATSTTDHVTTTLESVTLEAGLDGFALEVEAAIASLAGGSAEVTMRTADVRDRAAAISGRLDAVWPDLGALSLLSPEIGEVGGTLAMSIAVGGTAAEPALAGEATLEGGHIAVPEWGVLIDRITATALSPDGERLEFSGTGYIEDSELRLSGVTELDPAAGWPTEMGLEGDEIPVARRPDALVYASPDFDITIDLPRIDVRGSVLVPEADISVGALPSQAVRVSSDSIVHGEADAGVVRPLEVTADVTVELGDRVRYRGANLIADLSGDLRLEYASGLSPTAGGSLTLAGSYEAYGQSLALEQGELLFAGPLNDPAIDVLAVREIGATTVGIRLSGTLLAPEPSLYSDPPMSEANALSYLMFGRPLSASDDTDAATLQSTALALGLQQALPVVQRVGETLRLDELSIEPTEVDAGSLMAGKYLSPKVYMSYSYGLFNRLGGFLLRYQINERFSLETRSGNEKSMDLLYSIEKD